MLIFFITFAFSMKISPYIIRLIKLQVVTAVLICLSVASFATLGDGGKKSHSTTLLSSRPYHYDFKNFTLKSGYNYRGNFILNKQKDEKFIMLNTVITYQKGNNSYILPLKKKVLLDKVNFKPSQIRH